MVYPEYEAYKSKYIIIQGVYNSILTEKEALFEKTQAKAIRYDKEKVQSSVGGNGFDEYLIAVEKKKIDKRLNVARQLMEDRERLLQIKEKELRQSHDRMDIIYAMRYIDGKKPYLIAKALNYSNSQVYRILNQIDRDIKKDATKCEK